jgi:DNA (cytosine-5)-methyltransferase 1
MHNLGTYPCSFHFIEPSDQERMEQTLRNAMMPRGRPVVQAFVAGAGYLAHHPEHPGVGHFWLGDVRKITGHDLLTAVGLDVGELDCLAGGPPCQGFSTAGKQNVMDPRSSLIFEFARLICEMQPKTMIFENVPGILSMVTPEGVPVLDAFCAILADGHYGTFESLRTTMLSHPDARAMVKGQKCGHGRGSIKKILQAEREATKGPRDEADDVQTQPSLF